MFSSNNVSFGFNHLTVSKKYTGCGCLISPSQGSESSRRHPKDILCQKIAIRKEVYELIMRSTGAKIWMLHKYLIFLYVDSAYQTKALFYNLHKNMYTQHSRSICKRMWPLSYHHPLIVMIYFSELKTEFPSILTGRGMHTACPGQIITLPKQRIKKARLWQETQGLAKALRVRVGERGNQSFACLYVHWDASVLVGSRHGVCLCVSVILLILTVGALSGIPGCHTIYL